MTKEKDSEKNTAVAKELYVEFEDADILQLLAGEKDSHLKLIEKEALVNIIRSNGGLVISGQDADVDLSADLLNQLKTALKGNNQLGKRDISRALKFLASDRNADITEVLNEQIPVSGKKYSIYPKTKNQKDYIDAIRNNDLVFGVGPAGTGKTYLAMAMAVAAYMKKEVKRIVLCRPAVEAGEKLGFLPGDLVEKVNPYLRPLYDALHDLLDYEQGQELIDKGVIEVAPLAFMRGRTLSNAFVILDEAQNTNSGQMKMMLTRLGENSKCLITGDITQIDLPNGVKSGLVEALDILKDIQGIKVVYFNEKDVIRHSLVAKIIAAYDSKK